MAKALVLLPVLVVPRYRRRQGIVGDCVLRSVIRTAANSVAAVGQIKWSYLWFDFVGHHAGFRSETIGPWPDSCRQCAIVGDCAVAARIEVDGYKVVEVG